jgi:hypothetical protein
MPRLRSHGKDAPGDGKENEEDKKRRGWEGEGRKSRSTEKPTFKPVSLPSFQLGHDMHHR